MQPPKVYRRTWESPAPGQPPDSWVPTLDAHWGHRGALHTTEAWGPPLKSDVLAVGVVSSLRRLKLQVGTTAVEAPMPAAVN